MVKNNSFRKTILLIAMTIVLDFQVVTADTKKTTGEHLQKINNGIDTIQELGKDAIENEREMETWEIVVISIACLVVVLGIIGLIKCVFCCN